MLGRLLLGLTTALASSLAHGQEPSLQPGSKAPDVSIKRWIKGAAVRSIPAKGIVVVEFWATWCTPCRESIPHLTEMSKQYKKVQFVGVDIWEADGANIDQFVKKMGAQMDYAVGYSGDHDAMANTWMAAAGQTGIPTAFIVRNGVVQWIGLPWNMAKPLSDVVAGRLDVGAAKKTFLESLDADAQAVKDKQQLADIAKMFTDGQQGEAAKQLDAFEATHSVDRTSFVNLEIRRMRLFWLAAGNQAKFLETERAILGDRADMFGQVGVICPVIVQLTYKQATFGQAAEAVKILAALKGKDPEVYRFAAIVHTKMKQPAESAHYAQLGLDFLKGKTGEGVETLRKELQWYVDQKNGG